MFLNFNKFSKIPLNFNFEKFWRILKILFKFFNKIFKIFQKSLMSLFLLNVPLSEPKFCRRHCSTGLEWNSCMKFCSLFSPNQNKIWRHPWFSSCYYNFSRWNYWHFCIQFFSSIKFYSVIFCIFIGILYYTTF